MCGAVSAATSETITKTSTIHPTSKQVSSSITYFKLIDYGVTRTKGYFVKKDSLGRYSIYGTGTAYNGMKYPTKYYWKTYLSYTGNIYIFTAFYHTTLKRNMIQFITIGNVRGYGGESFIKLSLSPKSWGNSGYCSVGSPNLTPFQYYWYTHGDGYSSFRSMMIKHAPFN